ncbi:MAG: enoyl-CoA hydratase/isomerase family protein [Phycisphaerales bacterium]|jgi:cyclohexa-1,5-dienecarbonyl-CoA hydratase|nr:enoyl-CoA hydratase/isomerase family protein [Phycisphaerales bacterium]
MTTTTYEFIESDVQDGIATITLDNAPVNVLDIPMMTEINAALDEITTQDVAVIVFNAVNKAFCAGVDVSDHAEDKVDEMVKQFHGIFRRLTASDALSIAVVNGAALGGGMELACFCDIVLASAKSKFGQPEVKVGVFPPVAAAMLPLQIGTRKAIELVVCGETIKANEAHRIGLVSHVYEVETFEENVAKYLSNLRGLSRPVIRMAKKACTVADRAEVMHRLDEAEKIYMEELMKLADAHEGISAFLEKREANWSHS